MWCLRTLANLGLRATEAECTWNIWLLLEMGITSTSKHSKPELLADMFYFYDVFNSVEMWLLDLILNRYRGQISYIFLYTRSANASQFEFVNLPSSLIQREASSFGINFKTLLKSVSPCDEIFCCVWMRCIKPHSKGQIHLWCNFQGILQRFEIFFIQMITAQEAWTLPQLDPCAFCTECQSYSGFLKCSFGLRDEVVTDHFHFSLSQGENSTDEANLAYSLVIHT